MYNLRRLLVSSMALALIGGSALAGDKDKHDGGRDGSWEKLGKVTATHGADHDKIKVEGRNDDFRKLKFKVTDSPLNMHKVVVTYDSGAPESLDVRENIARDSETRARPEGRQAQHPHDRVLVRHEGPAERQGRRDGVRAALTNGATRLR